METKKTKTIKKIAGLTVKITPWLIGILAILSIFFTKPTESLTAIMLGYFILILVLAYFIENSAGFLTPWFKITSTEKGYKRIPQPVRIYAIIACGVMVIGQTSFYILRGIVHEGFKYINIHYMLIPFVVAGLVIVFVGLSLEIHGKVSEKWILMLPPDEEDLAV